MSFYLSQKEIKAINQIIKWEGITLSEWNRDRDNNIKVFYENESTFFDLYHRGFCRQGSIGNKLITRKGEIALKIIEAIDKSAKP